MRFLFTTILSATLLTTCLAVYDDFAIVSEGSSCTDYAPSTPSSAASTACSLDFKKSLTCDGQGQDRKWKQNQLCEYRSENGLNALPGGACYGQIICSCTSPDEINHIGGLDLSLQDFANKLYSGKTPKAAMAFLKSDVHSESARKHWPEALGIKDGYAPIWEQKWIDKVNAG